MSVGKYQAVRVSSVTEDKPNDFNLDQVYDLGFRFFGGKPILDQPAVMDKIDSGTMLSGTNGVITYTFLDKSHLTGYPAVLAKQKKLLVGGQYSVYVMDLDDKEIGRASCRERV